ncbi:uncharacterized protein LOC135204616 [Macrobrachium nipponense]|uniref:uncharacterized protein LOC135204616 n=1 Tax=Macrobrachium nipponense TaxID=159736 RepID=UPI0030C896F7
MEVTKAITSEHTKGQRKETTTQRKRRLQKARKKYQEKRAAETELEKHQRLEQRRTRLLNETSERRKTRLEVERVRRAQSRAEKMAKQREARLEVQRVHHAKRVQEQIGLSPTFKNVDNKFCDRLCEICHKRCYPNQIYKVKYNVAALSYLPPSLTPKPSLLLCFLCRKHVMSNKTEGPSNAYWNNLDPGIIPEEILIHPEVPVKSETEDPLSLSKSELSSEVPVESEIEDPLSLSQSELTSEVPVESETEDPLSLWPSVDTVNLPVKSEVDGSLPLSQSEGTSEVPMESEIEDPLSVSLVNYEKDLVKEKSTAGNRGQVSNNVHPCYSFHQRNSALLQGAWMNMALLRVQ